MRHDFQSVFANQSSSEIEAKQQELLQEAARRYGKDPKAKNAADALIRENASLAQSSLGNPTLRPSAIGTDAVGTEGIAPQLVPKGDGLGGRR